MKIAAVIEYLDEIAPSNYQESYDNAGLIVGDLNDEITGVITCLDSTEAVVDEAIHKKCNLIIAHHPIIFSGLKKLSGNYYVQKIIRKAIKNDIAIFAIHTNLDNMLINGVNTKICDRLGLLNHSALQFKENLDSCTKAVGTGILASLSKAMSAADFMAHLATKMETNCIKHTKFLGRPIKTIAVCGGSGSFLLSKAIAKKADVFITSDFKYHEFFDANDQIIIADIGHYESEKFTIQLLLELIQNKFSTFAAHCTNVDTNPVKYIT